jgi:hypothetical protein
MPNKVALICDTHFGVRGDLTSLHPYLDKFYNDIFFPTIDRLGIDHVIHLGDLVDRRKFINFITANHLDSTFIKPLLARNIRLDVMVGNHDCPFKNSNDFNAVETLYSNSKINIYTKPTEVDVKGFPILYVPWVCSENIALTHEAIQFTRAQIALGHLELAGFEMYRGSICEKGMDGNLFNKFDMVCSGHFHHKSTVGNINYLGAPYEMIWSDFNDPRGFHILDLDTRKLEFIQNPYNLFFKLFYDDVNNTLEELINQNFKQYNNAYVKVVVKQKTSHSLFDTFIDRLEKANPIDVQVVEDHLNLDLEDDQEIVDEAEDTLTILNKFVDSLNIKTDKTAIKQVLQELYNEASNMEVA